MPTNHHRVVLGVLDSLPRGIELFQAILDNHDAGELPLLLSRDIDDGHNQTLHNAGLVEAGTIEDIRIHCHILWVDAVVPPAHRTNDLIQELMESSPELFRSLVDEYLCDGKVLVAKSLQGMQELEASLTKLILRYANDRFHIIDL